MIPITIQPLCDDLPLPRYVTSGSVGMDVYARLDAPFVLAVGARCAIPCGFALALPEGLEAQIRPRSGLALKYGITVLNTPGTIDADYRGEVAVILFNAGEQEFTLLRGNRIAQMIIAPVTRVMWQTVSPTGSLPATDRGSGSFGSTGV